MLRIDSIMLISPQEMRQILFLGFSRLPNNFSVEVILLGYSKSLNETPEKSLKKPTRQTSEVNARRVGRQR